MPITLPNAVSCIQAREACETCTGTYHHIYHGGIFHIHFFLLQYHLAQIFSLKVCSFSVPENDICKLTYRVYSLTQEVCEASDGTVFSFEQCPLTL